MRVGRPVALQCARLFALMLLCSPALAHAAESTHAYPECAKQTTPAELEAAKGGFQAGSAAFKDGNYARAITFWEDAYTRDCTAHALLLNLARAYELAGQKAQAVVALETFLQREPNTEEKEQILNRIDVLKKSLTADQNATKPAEPSQPTTPPKREPANDVATSKKPISPIIMTAAGGAVLITGGVVMLIASNKMDDIDAKCFQGKECSRDASGQLRSRTEASELTEDGNSARTLNTIGAIAAGVGAAAVVGGLSWYVLAPKQTNASNAAQTSLVPTFSQNFAGLSLNGNF